MVSYFDIGGTIVTEPFVRAGLKNDDAENVVTVLNPSISASSVVECVLSFTRLLEGAVIRPRTWMGACSWR